MCGRSGSGKTTLLKLLKKQLAPYGERTGDIFVLGKKIEEQSEQESVTAVGFVMQNSNTSIVTETVWRELAFGLESLGKSSDEIRRKTAEISVYFGLEPIYNKKTEYLSGGERQIVNLASVMLHEPEILLLDEPTSRLDTISAKKLISHIIRLNRELGTTVIISEHYTDDIFSYANRVILLEKGKLIENSHPKHISQNFSEIFLPTSARIHRAISPNANEILVTSAEIRRYILDNYTITKNIMPISSQPEQNNENILKIRNIYFRYSKNESDILTNLSLDVKKGEIFSIIGSNGSGKSTLLKIILGTEKIYSGFYKRSKKIKISMLPQDPREIFFKSTVEEDLLSVCDNKERISDICEFLGISELMSRHPYDLSGGEQQKTALAKILLTSPDIILLDEPTKAMDFESRQSVISIIRNLKKSGVTQIIVTHDTRTASECSDRCAFLFNKNIVSIDEPKRFFSQLTYFTTPEAQIARGIFQNAVTMSDVVEMCRKNNIK